MEKDLFATKKEQKCIVCVKANLNKWQKAIYKVDKLVLVNCDIFEEYLETFRL